MDFKEQVKKGFQACKEDIETLFDENKQLNISLDSISQENKELKSELHELKTLLSSFKEEFSTLHQELKEIKKQSAVPQVQEVTSPQISNLNLSQEARTSSPSRVVSATRDLPMQDPYEALLAFKAKSNKREMLKQKMMSLVGENGMNLSELKFMIVDHFKYCSKATFYNYLKELELERHIKIERSHSKNVVYIATLTREI